METGLLVLGPGASVIGEAALEFEVGIGGLGLICIVVGVAYKLYMSRGSPKRCPLVQVKGRQFGLYW